MNLTNLTNIAKNEINFIKVKQESSYIIKIIVRPTYELAHQILHKKLSICLKNLDNNQFSWEKIL
jgi:hypothetical protein